MERRGWRWRLTGLLLFSFVMLLMGACALPAAPGMASISSSAVSTSPARAPLPLSTAEIRDAYGRVPLHFEENRGQAPAHVRYLARTPGGTVALAPGKVLLAVHDRVVSLTFEGAAPTARLEAIDALEGRVNHLRTSDPRYWRTDIPTYARVRSPAVYPGVDLVFYGTQRRLEYDFVLAPGADPGRITLRVAGADRVELTADGDLRIRTGDHVVVQHAPVIYQERDGRRTLIDGRYVLRGRDRVAFRVGAYDRSRPLIIDPVITYATLLGGSSNDGASAITVDAAGHVYVAGSTSSTDFPVVNGLQPTKAGGPTSDLFIAKLNSTGTALVFSTYVGGTDDDSAIGIRLDGAGNIYVAGGTKSTDFPMANAFQDSWEKSFWDSSQAGFVLKLSPAGNALLYSTYLTGTAFAGQSTEDTCFFTSISGLAVDASGHAHVTGHTRTSNFPTTPDAMQAAPHISSATAECGGVFAAFITKLMPAGTSLAYSTYVDAAGTDVGNAIALDGANNIYVAGQSSNPPFPVTANLKPSGNSFGHYILKLTSAGAYVQATIVGGEATGLVVDAAGQPHVIGHAFANQTQDFATVNAFQQAPAGDLDGTVSKINAAGTAYVWSTYLGGSDWDRLTDLELDGAGNVWITGDSASADFPTKDPITSATAGALIVEFSPSGTLLFSTLIAASLGTGIAVDGNDDVYVGGSAGPGFSTTPGAFQTSHAGAADAFVLKLVFGATGPEPVVWTSPVKVAVDGNSITKTAGCNGCADAGAVSQQTIASGDGFVEFTVSANASLTAGLSTGNPGTSGGEIKFGLRFFAGSPGFVEVRESGVYKSDWQHVAGAVYKVAVEGGVVKYYQNSVLKYTSAQAPSSPLLVDASLLTVGSAVQNAMISTGSGGGTPPPDPPPTVAITAPEDGATVSGKTVTVSATASDNVGVASVQFKLDGVDLGTADTTAPYAITWDTTTTTNGPHTLTAVATDTEGNATTSAPVTVTVSNDTPGPGPDPQPVVWTNAVKVAVSGNTITKNAGCGGCADAGAVSQQTITSGTGFVEFTISTGAALTAGLSTGNPGTSGSEIDFGLRFFAGSSAYVEVRESGVYKWDWQHVAGAVYRVAVETGVVKYYQNGVLKYTSAQPPGSPLLVDASLLTVGSAVQNAMIATGP